MNLTGGRITYPPRSFRAGYAVVTLIVAKTSGLLGVPQYVIDNNNFGSLMFDDSRKLKFAGKVLKYLIFV